MAGGGIAPSSSYAVIAALCLLSLSLSLPSLLSASAAAERRANKSSPLGGILWATGKDESELDPAAAAEIEIEDEGGADGGFSSLESMLQWAIGHSDPAELKEKASDVQRLTSDELKKRQLEIKELMERLKMPSDAELMKVAIDDLNNSSLSLEDRQRALNEILILVEPIDNANDLGKLGGLVVVVRELYNPEPEIRMISASVLGKASQNNPPVQNQILALGTLPRLMKMIQSSYTEEAIKALYAISALIRDNDYAQELFYSEDGNLLLQGILSNFSIDTRLQKKAVTLVADLADYRLGNANSNTFPLSNRIFLKSIVDLTSSSDLVLQEKALLAIRSLVQLPSTEALLDFKDHCNLDIVLDKMKEHLEGKMKEEDEDSREYARDVEILRQQVHAVFHKKLEKV